MDYDKATHKIKVELQAAEWMVVHGNVCLGLRHPSNTGPTRTIALNFTKSIEAALLRCGLIDQDDIRLIHKVEIEETEKMKVPTS